MRTSGTRPDGVRWLALPFPLRPDMTATVEVPRDMTTEEANKLAAFVRAIAAAIEDPTNG